MKIRDGLRNDNIQDENNVFTRFIPFTGIWAIASWRRTYLDGLSSVRSLSLKIQEAINLHRRFQLIQAVH